MTNPLTPDEVAVSKRTHLPDFVIDAFNELLIESFHNGAARILQKDAVARIKAKHPELEFNMKWLDVERTFEAYGWKVVYDKPGWDESYDAFFRFTRR